MELLEVDCYLDLAVRDRRGMRSWHTNVISYQLRSLSAAHPFVWATLHMGQQRNFRLVRDPRGGQYLVWLEGYRLWIGDLSAPRPVSEALGEIVGWLGGRPRQLPRIRLDSYLPEWYFRLPRQEGPRVTVVASRRRPSGELVIRLRGALPWVTFTFVGDGTEWRVTWLSKYQLPLAAGALVAAVAGGVLWTRRRRARRRV